MNRFFVSFFIIIALLVTACEISEKEAEEAYQNALIYQKQSRNDSKKREDALYFFGVASKNEKFRKLEVAFGLYQNAAYMLIEKGDNIDLDTKNKYYKSIIAGVTILSEIKRESSEYDQSSLEKARIRNGADAYAKKIAQVLKNEKPALFSLL
ncbi:MAG: hypothetical protein K9G57_01835 [Ignavibacteriales bacterium]|nr:hypothetical protein [Ignavibacteriales bacterium]